MGALIVIGVFLLGPALAVGGFASAVAHWRGKRRGESGEQIGKRLRRAFWLGFLIMAGLEAIAFGLCIAALQGLG